MAKSIHIVALEWKWETVHEGYAEGTDDVRVFLTESGASNFAEKLNKLVDAYYEGPRPNVITPERAEIHKKIQALHPDAPLSFYKRSDSRRDKTLNRYIVKTIPLGAPTK